MASRSLAGFVARTLSVLIIPMASALAAPLPMSVTSIPLAAADGNSNEVVVVVHLSNADGTPKANAELPKQGEDPNGGVELKGSKWSFETLSVPDSYVGQVWKDYRQLQLADMRGQLRIMQIFAAVNASNPEETRTLYVLRILPRFGFQGGKKDPLPWRSGTYTFRVTYKDGNDQGTALGTLTIR
jgi:hypothetical protein